jgi:hypothetical protein
MKTTIEQRAEKMIECARKMTKAQIGTSGHLLTAEVRKALACRNLVAVFAGQDESLLSADIAVVFHKACELLSQSEE